MQVIYTKCTQQTQPTSHTHSRTHTRTHNYGPSVLGYSSNFPSAKLLKEQIVVLSVMVYGRQMYLICKLYVHITDMGAGLVIMKESCQKRYTFRHCRTRGAFRMQFTKRIIKCPIEHNVLFLIGHSEKKEKKKKKQDFFFFLKSALTMVGLLEHSL